MAHSTQTPAALSATQRTTSRQRVNLPARLTWKDHAGIVRFASVTTRDLSDGGAFVECPAGAPLPLFRLVHLQLEPATAGTGHPLASDRVLAAVWRVEQGTQGVAQGYALRFMVDPAQAPAAAAPRYAVADMAAAC
ncbi:MAG: PilZ domain-containing protein [Candidatus Binatia bacterium]